MTDQQLQGSINDYWTERAPSYDAYQQRPERRDLDVEAWGRVWSAALHRHRPTCSTSAPAAATSPACWPASATG